MLPFFVLLGCSFLPLTSATRLLQLRTQRHSRDSTLQPRNQQAPDFIPSTLDNDVASGGYFLNVSIGTPPQNLSLRIDTGRSDVFLGGPFDVSKSSSATDLGDSENNYILPDAAFHVNYVRDICSIDDISIKSLTMACLPQSNNGPSGVMGLSFTVTETNAMHGGPTYPSILDSMVAQGLIDSRAYSLWLDDMQAATGTILFGGYDTAKYSDPLTFLPIQPNANGSHDTMTVAWTSLAVINGAGSTTITSSDFAVAALLDSGVSRTAVPDDIFSELATFFGVVNTTEAGYLLSCDIANGAGSLDFTFGGSAFISVPFSEIVLPAFDKQGSPLTFSDGSSACQFGLVPASDYGGLVVMGDTFLRSAYVVYDLDNLQIGLAATQYGVADSFPVEIQKGSVVITVASTVVSATSVRQTNAAASLLPGIGGVTTAANSMVTEAPATPAALPTASIVSAGSQGVIGTSSKEYKRRCLAVLGLAAFSMFIVG